MGENVIMRIHCTTKLRIFSLGLIYLTLHSQPATSHENRVTEDTQIKPDDQEDPEKKSPESPLQEDNGSNKILGYLNQVYDQKKPYYQKRWGENYFSKFTLNGLDSNVYRYMYRHHIPVWKMLSIGLGLDVSYFNFEESLPARPDPSSGTMIGANIEGHYLALGLGGRVQAGFDFSIFNISPYIDYNSDLIAKSMITIEGQDDIDEGKVEDGGKNKRLEFGVNIYLDLGGLSFGLGLASGSSNGDFGSSVKMNGIHLVIRSL